MGVGTWAWILGAWILHLFYVRWSDSQEFQQRLNRIRDVVGSGASLHESLSLLCETVADLDRSGSIPRLKVTGDPYILGLSHGFLLAPQVRAQYGNFLRRISKDSCVIAVTWVLFGKNRKPGTLERILATPLFLPGLRDFIRNLVLDHAWSELKPHVPSEFLDELQGLADGAGVSLKTVSRFHAVSEVASAGCSNLAAWGEATKEGEFLQYRNLDWSLDLGVQDHPLLLEVSRPRAHHTHISAGFVGFIGALQGINFQGITLGEVGAGSRFVRYDGMPMVFRLRKILEECASLDEVDSWMLQNNRTKGYNFVIGSVREKSARIYETNPRRAVVFRPNDPRDQACEYARALKDVAFRGDAAVDPDIRAGQHCADGPGDPRESHSYQYRYKLLADLALEHYGALDRDAMRKIARSSGMRSRNLVSVLYSKDIFFVAYAAGSQRACERDYAEVDWSLSAGISG